VFSIRFQQPPRNILGDLDCLLNGSTLGDQTREFRGGSQVVAVLDPLNVKPNGELIRHSRTNHTAVRHLPQWFSQDLDDRHL